MATCIQQATCLKQSCIQFPLKVIFSNWPVFSKHLSLVSTFWLSLKCLLNASWTIYAVAIQGCCRPVAVLYRFNTEYMAHEIRKVAVTENGCCKCCAFWLWTLLGNVIYIWLTDLTLRLKDFKKPVVYSTDLSKAVVPVLVLLFVALWFILRGDLFCLTLCHFVLVFFSPLSIAITSLWEESVNLSAFRTFVRFVLVWICRLSSSSWCLGRAVICDCGTPGTFFDIDMT